MNVLITVKTYWPEVNGVQNVTQYQAEGLAERGHNVTVITSDYQGKYPSEETHKNVKIIRLPIYDSNTIHHGDKKAFQRLVLELTKDCDAMMNVCLQGWAADWVIPVLSKIKCRKVLMNHSMHDFVWRERDFRSIKDFGKKVIKNVKYGIFYPKNWKYIAQYDAIAFSHEKDYALEYFKKHGYKNIFVLYNAVDDTFFDIDSSEKQNIILNVGTYNDRKNQLKTLELYYKASTSDYELVLIGMPDNDYYKELVRNNDQMKMENPSKKVTILCNADPDLTTWYFKHCKIYMTNSTWECLPVSLIDALAGGAAYLSSDAGVIKYVPGGIIANDDEAMVRNLELLIGGKWIELGRTAKENSEKNFTRKSQVDNLERLLCSE